MAISKRVSTAFQALLDALKADEWHASDLFLKPRIDSEDASDEILRCLDYQSKVDSLRKRITKMKLEWKQSASQCFRPRQDKQELLDCFVKPIASDLAPIEAYYKPVLELLHESKDARLGAAILIAKLEEKMKGALTDIDLQLLPSGNSRRWVARAKKAGAKMQEKGFLKKGLPYGIWEMTPKGRRYLLRLQKPIR